jgi:hypothetical protein
VSAFPVVMRQGVAEAARVAQGISGGATPSPGGVPADGKMGNLGNEMGGTT